MSDFVKNWKFDDDDPAIVDVTLECKNIDEVYYALHTLTRLDAYNVGLDVMGEIHQFGQTHDSYELHASIDSRSSAFALENILSIDRGEDE